MSRSMSFIRMASDRLSTSALISDSSMYWPYSSYSLAASSHLGSPGFPWTADRPGGTPSPACPPITTSVHDGGWGSP
jgi:hypothetical protein